MVKTHDEIKDIIAKAKDERDARIQMYQWGINRGYGKSDNPAKERFLTNVLEQPLDEIYANPNILWGRDKCKDDFVTRFGLVGENIRDGSEFAKFYNSKITVDGKPKVLTFDQWMRRFKNSNKITFYDICAFVSSTLGSDVFNVFLQNKKLKDIPEFVVVKNPGFISKHTEQFVEENEYRLSEGEKTIFKTLQELCEKFKVPFPKFPIEDIDNELWTPIENDELDICGWLCINKNTKQCYIIKIR